MGSLNQYVGVNEKTYTNDNPIVIEWISYFSDRMKGELVFSALDPKNIKTSSVIGGYVATQWYRFSTFMPWFLCRAAAVMRDNQKRHYVIQTAFEELGMRDVNDIHPTIFWNTAIGVQLPLMNEWLREVEVENSLRFLEDFICEAEDEHEVMGVLLGLEIPARENIEGIFSFMSINEDVQMELERSAFFILHRELEPEHIRLTISNFLRFCENESARAKFISGFDRGILFWSLFWTAIFNQTKKLKEDQ